MNLRWVEVAASHFILPARLELFSSSHWASLGLGRLSQRGRQPFYEDATCVIRSTRDGKLDVRLLGQGTRLSIMESDLSPLDFRGILV